MNNIKMIGYFLLALLICTLSIGCGSAGGGGGGGASGVVTHILTIDASAGKASAITLDDTGKPHIVYYKDMAAGTFETYTARWNGSSWDYEDIYVGLPCGASIYFIKCPGTSTTYWEYYPFYNQYGIYMGNSEWDDHGSGGSGFGSVSSFTPITSEYGGSSTIIKQTDTASIAAYATFYDYNTDSLMIFTEIITWEPHHTWSYSGVPQVIDNTANVGRFNSIGLNLQGSPEISYYDATNGDLKYAKWTGSTWSQQAVDQTDDVGQWTSIDHDSIGRPWICYYDVTHNTLKIASYEGSGWDKRQITEVGNGGKFASMKLDSQDRPVISYMGNSGGLWIAKWSGSAWSTAEVDPDPTDNLCSSLVLDTSNKARVSYYNSKNGAKELKYYWE